MLFTKSSVILSEATIWIPPWVWELMITQFTSHTYNTTPRSYLYFLWLSQVSHLPVSPFARLVWPACPTAHMIDRHRRGRFWWLWMISRLYQEKCDIQINIFSLIDDLMQKRQNSSALVVELCLFCIKPSKCCLWLTHWGRVTPICVGKLTIIGSKNGLSPGRRQAIIWTSAGILLIGHLGTNFSETFIRIHTFSFKEMHLKLSSAKWRPFCLGLNVLMFRLYKEN